MPPDPPRRQDAPVHGWWSKASGAACARCGAPICDQPSLPWWLLSLQGVGRNNGARRRAVGLTQEQLAEYLEIDTLTVSRHGTGNTLLPLTVVEQCSVEAK